MHTRTKTFLCSGIVFFCASFQVHQVPFGCPTPLSRLDLLHALAAGNVNIDAYHENTSDIAQFKGHYYSDKAPGTAALALPPFALAAGILSLLGVALDSETGWLFSSWVACVGSIGIITAFGTGCLFRWLLNHVPAKSAFVSCLAICLGAAPLPYATMMFSHALVVGLLAIAIWAIDRQGEWGMRSAGRGIWQCVRANRWDLLAGFTCGWVLASEYTAGLIVLGIFVWLLSLGWRRAIPFCLATIPPMLLIPAYSYACFGTPFVLSYSLNETFPAMKEGLYAIKWPDVETAFNLLFSPARGLFFWTPFLVMAGFGYVWLFKTSPSLFWLTYTMPVLQILVISGRVWDWPAGPTLGPRFLAPILPLMALPCAFGIQMFPKLGFILGSYSILITTLATLTNACPDFGMHPNPLLDLHIPLFLKGEFSPNLGMALGLTPYASVALFYAILIGGIWWTWRRLLKDQNFNPAPFTNVREPRVLSSYLASGKSPHRAFSLIELLVTAAVIGILAALLMPALSSARRKADSARCISNLRQLGIAARLYAEENEGRMPHARSFPQSETNAPSGLPAIQQVFAPQVRGVREVFKCPADKGGVFERDGSSYEWNTAVNGRILHRIDRPDEESTKTFLLRDREGWHPRGRKNAVFVDGHAGPADL